MKLCALMTGSGSGSGSGFEQTSGMIKFNSSSQSSSHVSVFLVYIRCQNSEQSSETTSVL